MLLNKLSLRLPIFGVLIRKAILARVSRTLLLTLSSGISLVDALDCAPDVANNAVYRDGIIHVRDTVIGGRGFYVSIEETHLFPVMILQMIGVGEKLGSLEDMLKRIADHFDEEVNTMVDGLSTLIEPIMLVFLGVVVDAFVISMYLPIFRIGAIL